MKTKIILLMLFIGLLLVPTVSTAWWNSSWNSRTPIQINNTGNATILTNYQIYSNVTYN